MAIIRLDCNLNGGDSVTPNNELFYRIYGDVDAYASPIHTTGTALSDANVTVDNDNVIITGVDGATNTTFKIAAVDGAFNEGILSDASEESSILFEDTFAGTTIDTTTKWNFTEEAGTLVTFTQNNELLVNAPGTADDTSFATDLSGQATHDVASLQSVIFDFTDPDIAQSDKSFYGVGITKDDPMTDNQDRIGIQASNGGNLTLIVKQGGSNIYSNPHALDVSSAMTFKIVIGATTVDFYNWTTSWQLIHSVTGTITGSWMPFVTMADKAAASDNTIVVDNFYLSSSNPSTQYPV